MDGRSFRSLLRAAVIVAGSALVLSGCALASRVVTVAQGDGVVTTCTVLVLDTPAAAPASAAELDAIAGVIRARMEALDVPGVTVDVIGPDMLMLGLPAGDDAAWRAVATRPGRLSFVPVPPAFDQQVVDGEPMPAGMGPTPILTEADIASASAAEDQLGQPAVAVTLTPEGAVAFDAWAADNVGRRFAIVVDGVVLAAPVIREARFNGQAQISGSFTPEEVGALIAALDSGPLPAPLTELVTTSPVDGACPAMGIEP